MIISTFDFDGPGYGRRYPSYAWRGALRKVPRSLYRAPFPFDLPRYILPLYVCSFLVRASHFSRTSHAQDIR